MKKEELNGVARVRFCDYSQYESEKSSNGGCYGFWTDYTRQEDGNWEVSYGTTADFPLATSTIITKVMIAASNPGIAVAIMKLSQRKNSLSSSTSLRKQRMSTSNSSNRLIF